MDVAPWWTSKRIQVQGSSTFSGKFDFLVPQRRKQPTGDFWPFYVLLLPLFIVYSYHLLAHSFSTYSFPSSLTTFPFFILYALILHCMPTVLISPPPLCWPWQAVMSGRWRPLWSRTLWNSPPESRSSPGCCSAAAAAGTQQAPGLSGWNLQSPQLFMSGESVKRIHSTGLTRGTKWTCFHPESSRVPPTSQWVAESQAVLHVAREGRSHQPADVTRAWAQLGMRQQEISCKEKNYFHSSVNLLPMSVPITTCTCYWS